jgi:acetyl/propionyl-CoA carboxylase alpha subunit
MAKIVARGPDRASALALLRRAIATTRLSGVASNLSFHAAALADPEFQAGGVDTGFVARLLANKPSMEVAGHG